MSVTTKKIASIEIIKAGSSPDIDSDYNTEVRELVLDEAAKSHGADKIANIVTFTTLAAKGAFKSMCTIYKIPYAQANKVASTIPGPIEGVECTIEDIFNPFSDRYDEGAEFRSATSGSEWVKIIEGAKNIEGRNKNTGIHPCGVILSSQSLASAIPLQIRQQDGKVVTQWSYTDCEDMGLIKMDYLGLDTVDLIQNAVTNVQKNGKTPPNMVSLIHGDMDDKKTYEMLRRGETVGVFQLASSGVMDLLRRMEADAFNDIVATTALYRPGPMGMLSHVKYADRKTGREEVDYIHPDFKGSPLEEILGGTFGLCVPAGTKVFNSKTGVPTNIENVTDDGEFWTPSFNESTGLFESKRVKNKVHTGVKKILSIKASGNKKLRLSETHPVLTRRGWVESKDIVVGDYIYSSYVGKPMFEVEDPSEITKGQAWLVGAFLGDGTVSGDWSPFITNTDDEILNFAKKVGDEDFNGVFSIIKAQKERPGAKTPYTVELRSSDHFPIRTHKLRGKAPSLHPVNILFEKLGLIGRVKTAQKKLTDEMFEMSNENLRWLIAGLWDTDGSVHATGPSLSTISKGLWETLQLAFDRLGINYAIGQGSSTVKDKTFNSFRIFPSTVDFANHIQPLLQVDRKRNFKLADRRNKSHIQLSQELLDEQGYTNSFNTSWKKFRLDSGISDSHEAYQWGLENVASEKLRNLSKMTPLRVYEIVEDGFEDCWDIEVEDNNNFVVSGAIVHNCVYQEQIIKIASEIAGMTLQEGDDLRSAMGKKKVAVMDKMKPKFFDGSMANGYSEEAVTVLWDTIALFAKYGFNKSHSVAYAMNAYQAAYLKANYPVEFMASLISQNIGVKDKILAFLKEARRMGLKVGTVDINVSDIKVAPDFTKKSGFDIVYGLSGINAVSNDAAAIIVKERNKKGVFKSVQDLINRCLPLGVSNKRVYENLALAGAFDSFGLTRRGIVESLPGMISQAKTKNSRGTSLFDMFNSKSEVVIEASSNVDEFEEYPFVEKLKKEADVIGLYLTGHPLDKMGTGASSIRQTTIEKLFKNDSQTTVTIAGSITDIIKKTTKRGGKSIEVAIDDGTGYVNAFLDRSIVKGIEKMASQEKLRKLYEAGENTFTPDIQAITANPEFNAIEDIEKNSVYVISLTFRPARGDSPVGARVHSIRPLKLAVDGSLPIRIRFHATPGNEENVKKLYRILPMNLAKKMPGDYPIHVSIFRNIERNLPASDEHIYLDAMTQMKSDMKNDVNLQAAVVEAEDDSSTTLSGDKAVQKSKKRKVAAKNIQLREWPPPAVNSPVDKKIVDVTAAANERMIRSIESLEYKDTGLKAAKSSDIKRVIEKYVGVENFDFGVFDETILDIN